MVTRLARLGPLTGVVSGALILAAFATSHKPPDANAPGTQVVAFYQAHSTGQQTSDSLWTLAFAIFVFFAGSLRGHLRRTPAAEPISTVALAGAAVLAAGGATYFGFDLALANAPGDLAPAAGQALNVLALDLFLPLSAGGFVFGIASGVAILRSGQLPKWLGWLAIVIGLAMPAAILALPLLAIWAIVTSLILFKRSSTYLHPPTAGPSSTAGATNC